MNNTHANKVTTNTMTSSEDEPRQQNKLPSPHKCWYFHKSNTYIFMQVHTILRVQANNTLRQKADGVYDPLARVLSTLHQSAILPHYIPFKGGAALMKMANRSTQLVDLNLIAPPQWRATQTC